MKNLHIKNLNSEKILKELAKNPKAYLNYIFNQNANNMYPTLYSFKKLPIIEEFNDTITEILYNITKEKISTIDKIVNAISFEYNKKFLFSYYKRNEFTNNQITGDLIDYLIEHYLLHSLYSTSEVKKINTTLNKKYNKLLITQPRVPDHSTINHSVTILELYDEENNETNIENLQNELKDIKATILNNPNMNILDRINSYIYHHLNDEILNIFNITYVLHIDDIIKDTIKKTLIALKKLQVLNFDDEILY